MGTGGEERLSSPDVAGTTAAAAPAQETASAPSKAAEVTVTSTETTAKTTDEKPAETEATTEAGSTTSAPATGAAATDAAATDAAATGAAAATATAATASAPTASSGPGPIDASNFDPIEPMPAAAESTTNDTDVAEETDDHGFSDTDSAISDPDYLSFVSLADSVRNYREENGRTYHSLSAGKYWCPNDDPENNRLDLQHHAHRLTFNNQLCVCPKQHGAKRVLDLGTGTGIWAMEYAEDHPEAEVIGVDLSPIQPEFVPANCVFEIDDLEKEWTWSRPFDFIWWRAMLGCFADAQAMVQKCYDNLEPGGYLEMHDGTFPPECDDDTLPEDCSLMQLTRLATQASAALGRPIDISPHYAKLMQEAGFVDIVFAKYKWPTNPWPRNITQKTIGAWTLGNVDPGLEGLFMALLTRGLGMSVAETTVLCAQARKDMRNPNIHAYWPVYYCYGRKPE